MQCAAAALEYSRAMNQTVENSAPPSVLLKFSKYDFFQKVI
jgi:hypothetical protein